MPYIHPMLRYLNVFISLILDYLMTLFWFNINRYFLLQITLSTLTNFRILMLIRIHHRHILNLSICVSKSALFISTNAICSVVGNGSLSIFYACVESGDLGIGHDVVSADGVALRGAVLVHHVYLQILLLILLHH